jgi:hypothetical protein
MRLFTRPVLLFFRELNRHIFRQSQPGFDLDRFDDADRHRAGGVAAKALAHLVSKRHTPPEGDFLEWVDLGQLYSHFLNGGAFGLDGDIAGVAIHFCLDLGRETTYTGENLCFCQAKLL